MCPSTGFPTRRTIWFVLNQIGVADSEELYRRIALLTITWQLITTDSGGNVTYHTSCYDGEQFKKLRRLFHDNEFLLVWGIIKSGVYEDGQYQDWPKEPMQTPPAPTQVSKKTFARTVWDNLRKLFGSEVIK
jgi:hypothetical protein